MSAYYYSKDEVFKDKAIDLGDRLITAFLKGKNGIPIVYIFFNHIFNYFIIILYYIERNQYSNHKTKKININWIS